MSYDIMVIDHHPRFKKSKDFLSWYDNVTKWEDEVDYNDYRHATTPLQNWYLEMKDVVPPLNGQFAPANDKLGTGEFPEADYSIAKDAIYVALSYEKVEEVKEAVAQKAEAVAEKAEEVKEAVAEKVEDIKEAVEEKIEGIKENFEKKDE